MKKQHWPEAIVPTILCLSLGMILVKMLIMNTHAQAEERKTPAPSVGRVKQERYVPKPRQVFVSGDLADVDRRANALMLQGWRVIPGTVALAPLHHVTGYGQLPYAAALVLEFKPRTGE